MMSIQERIHSLVQLHDDLLDLSRPEMLEICVKAERENPWFTQQNLMDALVSIRDQFLDRDSLISLVNRYKLDDNIKALRVGLVLAGNIPMVGFHDILCCYLVGHHSLIKYSEKDKALLQFLLAKLKELSPGSSQYFEEINRLENFDAVIATGSNSAAIHFEYYFKHVPHIIRKNRNSVAILSGNETAEQLKSLGKDIFTYFGLGCRNVSKIYIPNGYDVTKLFVAFDGFEDVIHHNKYKNNFDYNVALFLLNKEAFLSNDILILKESDQIMSRIGSLHYQYYDDEISLQQMLKSKSDEIQCIVTGSNRMSDIPTIPFGTTQNPSLDTYADGVNTIQFLLGL